MGFIQWWKTSSAKAGAEHYRLRFDADELSRLRAGQLTESARAKFNARLQSYKKLIGGILIVCGIVLSVVGFPFALLLGYGIYSVAGALHKSFAAWIWLGFMLFVLSLMFVGCVYAVVKIFALNRSVVADLNSPRVGIEQGQVNLKTVGTSGNRKLQYWMNNVQYRVLNDAIGSETRLHFQDAAKTVGKHESQTNEIYRFYFLPTSKLLLHFERA